MKLLEQINERRRDIKTDGYALSISEWMSMYQSNELDIHPEFQRFFRWSDEQKTSLIESILLGIPLPQVFVSQRKDGVWDVVDGLQRLSTIFQFFGILRDEDNKYVDPLILQGTNYLPDLEGIRCSGDNDSRLLPKELQLVIKRSKISVSIILRESDETAKYDLFQRLNTGGSELSPQEVRNCLMVMLNKPMFDWLRSLAKNSQFVYSTALSDRPIEESYDVELALRFVLLSLIGEDEIKSIGDVGRFLTDRMTAVAQDKKFKKPVYKNLFESTFSVIESVLGDDAFKRFNSKKGRHEGGFLLSLFEVVALGIAYNLHQDTLCDLDEISERVQKVWSDPNFTKWAASGVTASRRLPRLIPYGRKLFEAD